jgi:hypothetical protein
MHGKIDDDEWAAIEQEAREEHEKELADPIVMDEFSRIAERFPCLRGAPGVRPFNIRTLVGWAINVEAQHKRNPSPTSAEIRANGSIMSAVLLFCRLTNHFDDRPVLGESQLNESHRQFDVYCALSWWGEGDRAAFAEWAREGTLPLDRLQRENLRAERVAKSSNVN